MSIAWVINGTEDSIVRGTPKCLSAILTEYTHNYAHTHCFCEDDSRTNKESGLLCSRCCDVSVWCVFVKCTQHLIHKRNSKSFGWVWFCVRRKWPHSLCTMMWTINKTIYEYSDVTQCHVATDSYWYAMELNVTHSVVHSATLFEWKRDIHLFVT